MQNCPETKLAWEAPEMTLISEDLDDVALFNGGNSDGVSVES